MSVLYLSAFSYQTHDIRALLHLQLSPDPTVIKLLHLLGTCGKYSHGTLEHVCTCPWMSQCSSELTQSRPLICNSVLLIRHGSTFAWLSSWFYKLTGYSAYCCCCCVNIYSSVSMYTDLISHIPLWRTKQQICCWVNMENDQPNTPLHLRGVTGPMTQRHKSSRPSCLKLWSCVQRSVSLWIYIMS